VDGEDEAGRASGVGIDIKRAGRSRAEEREQQWKRSAGMQWAGAAGWCSVMVDWVDGGLWWSRGVHVGFVVRR
jgi:hypothetical protein